MKKTDIKFRLRTIVAAMIMIVLAAADGAAQTTFTEGDFNYLILEDGTVQLGDGTNSAWATETYSPTTLEIPATVTHEGTTYDVTKIGERAFSSLPITTLTFAANSNLTTIGDGAFTGTNLQGSVAIPKSVTTIESNVFANIDESGSTLTVTFEAGTTITEISNYLFSGAYNLKSFTIPESVTTIGDYAFDNSHVQSITIPKNVVEIGTQPFARNSELKSITFDDECQITSIPSNFAWQCSGLTTVSLPESITSIGTQAFSECPSITNITIPKNVTSIGDDAFSYFCALNEITFMSTTPPALGDNVFDVSANENYCGDYLASADNIKVNISPCADIEAYTTAFNGVLSADQISSDLTLDDSDFSGIDFTKEYDGSNEISFADQTITTEQGYTLTLNSASLWEYDNDELTASTTVGKDKVVTVNYDLSLDSETEACLTGKTIQLNDITGSITSTVDITIATNSNKQFTIPGVEGRTALTATTATNDVSISYSNGEFNLQANENATAGDYVFKDDDNTITVNVTVQANYTVTLAAHMEFVSENTTFTPDDEVKFKISDGYTFAVQDLSWTPTTLRISTPDDDGIYTFTMPSDNVVITATIKRDPKLTVSIENWTYGDTPNDPEIECADGFTPTIQYTKDHKNFSQEPPTAAGTYYVVATVDETEEYASASVETEFTIDKKTITADDIKPLIELSKEYDGGTWVYSTDGTNLSNNSATNLTYTSGSDNVTFVFTSVAYTSKGVGATTITAYPSITGGDNYENYQFPTSETGMVFSDGVEITPKTLSIPDITATIEKEYDGTTTYNTANLPSPNLAPKTGEVITTEDGSSEDVSIEITAITFEDANASTDKNATITLGLTGTDSDNYILASSTTTIATATINPLEINVNDANLTITLDEDFDYTYDGTEKEPSVTLTYKLSDTQTLTIPTTEYSVEYTDNISAGEATVTITNQTGGNFTIGQRETTFTIEKADVTVHVTEPTTTYGDAVSTDDITHDGTDDMQITFECDGVLNATTTPGAGEYTITPTSGSDNYNVTFDPPTPIWTIEKATPDVSVSSTEDYLCGYSWNPDLVSTYHPGAIQNSENNLGLSWTILDPITKETITAPSKSGTYTVTVYGDDNYNGTTYDFEVNYRKYQIESVALADNQSSYTYNGLEITPSLTVLDANSNEVDPDDYTVTYTHATEGADNHTDPGTVTITVTGQNCYDGTKTAAFTIAPLYHTVTFATIHGAAPDDQSVEHNSTATQPADLEATGHTFRGWYSDDNYTTAFDFTEPITTDITLYAKWDINQYTITFVNYDGETVLQSTEIEYGSTPTYDGDEPTKTATAEFTYTFSGWDSEIESVTAAKTYTAQFTPTKNKYTIEFVNYDGAVLQSSEVEYGTTPTYDGTTPTKDATAEFTYTRSAAGIQKSKA